MFIDRLEAASSPFMNPTFSPVVSTESMTRRRVSVEACIVASLASPNGSRLLTEFEIGRFVRDRFGFENTSRRVVSQILLRMLTRGRNRFASSRRSFVPSIFASRRSRTTREGAREEIRGVRSDDPRPYGTAQILPHSGTRGSSPIDQDAHGIRCAGRVQPILILSKGAFDGKDPCGSRRGILGSVRRSNKNDVDSEESESRRYSRNHFDGRVRKAIREERHSASIKSRSVPVSIPPFVVSTYGILST
jgi:hypothetical protein